MELNNTNQQPQPATVPTENLSKKHIVTNQKGNFKLIFGIVIIISVVSLVGVYIFQIENNDSLKRENALGKEAQPTNNPSQEITLSKRVLFTKNGKLFSCVADCKNPVEVSVSTIEVQNLGSFMISPDSTKLLFC